MPNPAAVNQPANSAPVIVLSDAAEIASVGIDLARVRQALAMWSADDFDGCITQLDEIGLARHSSDSIFLRARALLRVHRIGEAEKWLRMMESRHTDEDAITTHAMLLLALAALSRCQTKDLHLEATLLHELAIGVAEIELRDPTHLDQLAHALPWTSHLVMEQVQTLRHIGLAYARVGEPHIAIARFVEAGGVKTQSPWAIVGFAEAANLCRRLNEVGATG